ncbi:hypothetical protein MY8738_002945 [Beauveria namnaoensis]
MSSHKPPEAVHRESSLQGQSMTESHCMLALSKRLHDPLPRCVTASIAAPSVTSGSPAQFWPQFRGPSVGLTTHASAVTATTEPYFAFCVTWVDKYGADSAAAGASAIDLDPYIGESIAAIYPSVRHDLSYSILLAASPHIETDIDNPALSQVNMFKRILTRERLINSLPKLLEDTDAVFGGLSDREAVVPIFPFMYRLVYKLTHRTGGVHEIAEDEELLDSTLKQFSSMEDCSLLQIMFTGWPLPSMLSKLWAGFKLHRVITGLMKERRRTGRNETDALQFLMNLGETDLEIVKCVIGILFSGLLNTGVNSAWLLSYLANDRMWYNKVQAEVDAFIARHRRTAAESVLDIVQRIPYHDWDTQLPVIDVCLRETLRINLYGPAIRKNISDEDVIIPGTDQVVPSKAFAFYAMDGVHLNESIYPNAFHWEPARHLPGREEGTNKAHDFVAWGSGLHPCIGSKVRYILAMRLQHVLTQSGRNS